MQEIGFSVATSIRPLNQPPSPSLHCPPVHPRLFSVLVSSGRSGFTIAIVRTPLRSGEKDLNARGRITHWVRAQKVTVSKLGPLRVPLEISFANKIPRVPRMRLRI